MLDAVEESSERLLRAKKSAYLEGSKCSFAFPSPLARWIERGLSSMEELRCGPLVSISELMFGIAELVTPDGLESFELLLSSDGVIDIKIFEKVFASRSVSGWTRSVTCMAGLELRGFGIERRRIYSSFATQIWYARYTKSSQSVLNSSTAFLNQAVSACAIHFTE